MATVSVTMKSRPKPLKTRQEPGPRKQAASRGGASVSRPHVLKTPNHRPSKLSWVPGRFGPWGGRYVPETLMAACEELEQENEKAKRDVGCLCCGEVRDPAARGANGRYVCASCLMPATK